MGIKSRRVPQCASNMRFFFTFFFAFFFLFARFLFTKMREGEGDELVQKDRTRTFELYRVSFAREMRDSLLAPRDPLEFPVFLIFIIAKDSRVALKGPILGLAEVERAKVRVRRIGKEDWTQPREKENYDSLRSLVWERQPTHVGVSKCSMYGWNSPPPFASKVEIPIIF